MSDKDIINHRLHFLSFDNQTFESLKNIQSILEPKIDHVLDRFYIHIFQEPELKALFPNEESIARSRKVQKEHWMDILFSGDLGKAHFDNAKRIGRSHERIGLSLSAYLGGYCIMLNQFLRVISDHFHDDNISLTKKIHALNKAVFLDIDSVIDSYLDAKDTAIKKVLMQAEQFTDGLKAVNSTLGKEATKHHQHLSKLLKQSSTLTKENSEIYNLIVEAEQQAALLDEKINNLNTRYNELQDKHNCHFFTSPERTVVQKVKSLFSSH